MSSAWRSSTSCPSSTASTLTSLVRFTLHLLTFLSNLASLFLQFPGPSGKQNEDILLATNFRIFLLMHESVSFINVPIMLVESIEIKEILFLYVYLKNAKTIRLSFSTSEKATLWYQRLNSIISKSIKLEELFAFTFYSWLTNEKSDESVIVDSDYPTRYLFSKSNLIKNIIVFLSVFCYLILIKGVLYQE